MRVVLIIFASSILACCRPEVLDSPPIQSDKDKFEVIWKVSITNGLYSISMDPLLFQDMVVINSEYPLHGEHAPVMFLDTVDGSIEHLWSATPNQIDSYGDYQAAVDGDFLMLGSHLRIDCMNMSTRQTNWVATMELNSPYIYANNGFVYRGIMHTWHNGRNKGASLMRASVSTGEWDTVYTLVQTGRYAPFFDAVGFGNLSNGDEVIVWKNRSEHTSQPDITEILAYNLTADSLMWRNRDHEVGSTIQPVQIYQGRVYAMLYDRMIALDLMTGKTIWNQDFSSRNFTLPQFFSEGEFYIDQNRMVVKGPNKEILIVGLHSGVLANVIDNEHYGIHDPFAYFEGKLFFGNDAGLSVIDAYTGESLIETRQVEHLGDIKCQILIDPARRVLYTHDGYYLYCVKIPENL
ncbi:MAG: PQQ-binding-like beta-propeller repeat protein [Flavobacteriia bacterium]|nr:PQQ-binding-like beta-propeller repeat protein [Flavobacteriia bacterium]